MKSFSSKLIFLFLGPLIVICHSCSHVEEAAVDTAGKQKAASDVKTNPETSDVVAEIGDYVITAEELEEKALSELLPPYSDEEYKIIYEPYSITSVLMKMLGDKAIMMKARELNYTEDKQIREWMRRFDRDELRDMLINRYVESKVVIEDSEIEKKIKNNPGLSREKAREVLLKSKFEKLGDELYEQVSNKLSAGKEDENLSEALDVYKKLLANSPRGGFVRFVRAKQVRNDLTEQEENIVLATFEGGKITMKDWLYTLTELVPPSSRGGMDTMRGFEQFLDTVIIDPLLAAEARNQGLDKDENFLERRKHLEDKYLGGKFINEKYNLIRVPSIDEVVDYYNNNKEEFTTPDELKIDQIWCKDFKTAKQVVTELRQGKDFALVKEQYSLSKASAPAQIESNSEGVLFHYIWPVEPNNISNPVKGFYRSKLTWRVVKVLEKRAGTLEGYVSGMKMDVKAKMLSKQRSEILAKYRKGLVTKYPYKIYSEKIKDPLSTP